MYHIPTKRPRPGRWPFAAAAALALCLTAGSAAAVVPSSMHVEGYLRSSVGGAIADGSYGLTVGLYAEKAGGTALWSDTFAKVPISGGRFSIVLGSAKALPPAVLAKADAAWLSIQVGGDPELPRMAIGAKAYALVSAVAEDLSCTGCVSVSAMKFDGDLDLSAHGVKAGKVMATDLVVNTVTAKTYIGDGSKLTGVQVPASTCPKGQAVGGVAQDGKLVCVAMGITLPNDAIDEVSNGLIFNQFTDQIGSPNAPIGILDNNPIGGTDTIDVPDLGLAQKLTVSINLTNSNIATLQIYLYDPANKAYTLWDKSGPGTSLVKTYPTPDKTLDGDLSAWVGKNPKGKWRLKVVDTAFLNNTTDGAVKAWSVNIQTLSNQKIQVKGETYVTGNLTVAGSLKVGDNQAACTASTLGQLRYDGKDMSWCDGKGWAAVGKGEASLYRWKVWGTYGVDGWYVGDNPSLFGGVKPSVWGDNHGLASQMSPVTEQLKTFFNNRGPPLAAGMKNANVYTEEWNYASTSTDSQHVGVLFRIRNNTGADIKWTVYWYRTAYYSWGERASIAVNGSNVWDGGSGNYSASDGSAHTLTLPKNRTSTVIFVAGSAPDSSYVRNTHLSFYNNSLLLPSGLEFVDDLDAKPDGWDK